MPEPTALQQFFAGYQCFVCSPAHQNEKGLHLVFTETADGARTEFRVSSHYHSYPGVLHGGVITAILDETIAYASLFKFRLLPFTRNLQLNFRRGVRPGALHVCTARLIETREDGFRGEAVIQDERGTRLVQAAGDFVYPTIEMAERMTAGLDLGPVRQFFRGGVSKDTGQEA